MPGTLKGLLDASFPPSVEGLVHLGADLVAPIPAVAAGPG